MRSLVTSGLKKALDIYSKHQTDKTCPHTYRRCLHGDEILRYMTFHWRFWKDPTINRQQCLHCKAALDLDPICSETPDEHLAYGRIDG